MEKLTRLKQLHIYIPVEEPKFPPCVQVTNKKLLCWPHPALTNGATGPVSEILFGCDVNWKEAFVRAGDKCMLIKVPINLDVIDDENDDFPTSYELDHRRMKEFFCRSCGTSLSHRQPENIKALPSEYWQELADSLWFCGCVTHDHGKPHPADAEANIANTNKLFPGYRAKPDTIYHRLAGAAQVGSEVSDKESASNVDARKMYRGKRKLRRIKSEPGAVEDVHEEEEHQSQEEDQNEVFKCDDTKQNGEGQGKGNGARNNALSLLSTEIQATRGKWMAGKSHFLVQWEDLKTKNLEIMGRLPLCVAPSAFSQQNEKDDNEWRGIQCAKCKAHLGLSFMDSRTNSAQPTFALHNVQAHAINCDGIRKFKSDLDTFFIRHWKVPRRCETS